MPYAFGTKIEEQVTPEYTPLDGNPRLVRPVDMSFDGGMPPTRPFHGRPVHTEHLPTKVRLSGRKREVTCVAKVASIFCVCERFRAIIEKFEPNIHQFVPVDIVWKDGSLAEKKYFFIVCNRLDSVDPELTTLERRGKAWIPNDDGENIIEFLEDKISGKHVWIDKFLPAGTYMSDEIAEEIIRSNISGAALIKMGRSK